ncbi:MAG: filamentous hemagglutinin N-terminal domain-containing protein, partial [Gammaproteobacteria bacterium]|nr:filamentous hemagglutinin N-terminal domain-containing protein [Gammaproteobacteria bacterium]
MRQTQLTLSIVLLLGSQVLLANPNGAQVVRGTASFANPSANVLNVTNSNNAIINWQSFNINAGQTTNFIQPSAASSVLNRVTSANPSQILGNLNSNGRVFLINQHGILVGAGAHINTNGFFGSTLNITDQDFLNGKLKFNGGGQGDLENQGYIHAGGDGNIVLIAPNIENGGVIEVEDGNIILAAGKSITISSLQNSSIQFEVSASENKITNLGQIIANRGAASLFAGSLQHSGSIRANGLVQNADGSISLVATGSNRISGSVEASGEQGGSVKILGDVVEIQDGAVINASGTLGGGEILIGGDQQGLNPALQNATSTTVAAGAQVHADATDNGDGGKVIVFASNDVHVHGEVTAKGGANGGDGGFVETSGLRVLDITSIPDASASLGANGEWLIDPFDIIINVTGGNDPVDPDGAGPLNEYSNAFTSSVDSTLLNVSLITAALDVGTNVTISTGGLGGTGLGDITLNAPVNVTGTTPGVFNLNAHNDIIVNADITSSSPMTVSLNANLDATGGGGVILNNTVIATGTNLATAPFTMTGDFIQVNGNAAIIKTQGSFIINAPLTINSAGSLSVGAASGAPTLTLSGQEIINDGTFITNGQCSDGCTTISIGNQFTNAGTFRSLGGITSIDGIFRNSGTLDIADAVDPLSGIYVGSLASGLLELNAGSSVIGVSAGKMRILSLGTLDVLSPTVFNPLLELTLQEGIIDNAQNLTIPDTFNWAGGIVSGNGAFITPVTSTTTIQGGQVLGSTLQGLSALQPLDWFNDGTILWSSIGIPDITLTNASIFNDGEFYISLTAGGQVSGTNAQIINGVGAALGIGVISVGAVNFNVPFENSGVLNIALATDTLNISNNLILENGALLMGEGTLNLSSGTGTLTVGNGGGIAPGQNDDGTINITGNLVINPGAQLMFDLESNTLAPVADRIVVSFGNTVTINGGELYALWEGPAGASGFTNVSDGGTFNLIDCSLSLAPCMTVNSPLTVHDPLNVTPAATPLAVISPVTDQNSLQYTLGTKTGTVFEWTGLGDTIWTTGTNWLGGIAPGPLDSAIIDGNGVVAPVGIVGPVSITNLQTDALFAFLGGSLSISGQAIVSSTYIPNTATPPSGLLIAGPGSTVTGTGVLTTLPGTYNIFDSDTNITINTWDQIGVLSKAGTTNLVFDGTLFNNIGAFEIEPTSAGDVQLLTTAQFNNNGFIISEANASIDLTTHGVDGKINVDQGILTLSQGLAPVGQINVSSGAVLAVGVGADLALPSGTIINGLGTLDIFGGTLTASPGAIIDPTMTLALSGSIINNAQNLTLPDTFNITGGSITGNGFWNTPFSDGSSININGPGALTIVGLEWYIDRDLFWNRTSSGNSINLNNSTLSIAENFFINNTSLGTAVSNIINGALEVWNDGFVSITGNALTTIQVPTKVSGFISLTDAAASLSITDINGLVLGNGGGLGGIGTYIGDVNVLSGGVVAPGLASGLGANIGTLNIVGDVTFEQSSMLLADLGWTSLTSDNLNVTGNVSLNSPELLTAWDGVSVSLTPTLPISPFELITASGTLTGDFLVVHDAIGTTTGVATPLASSYTYSPSGVAITNFWDGGAGDNQWNSAANWFTNAVPTVGQVVVIETAFVNLNTTGTALLGSLQLDLDFIDVASNLSVSGNLYSLPGTDIDLNGGTINGTGTLHNFGALFINQDVTTLGINRIHNHGYINWRPFGTAGNSLTFSGILDNFGGAEFVNNSSSVNTVSLAVGMSNAGNLISWGAPFQDIQVFGALTNELSGYIKVRDGELILDNPSNINSGLIDIDLNAIFSFSLFTPATYTMAGNAAVIGAGEFVIDPGGVLNVNVPTVFEPSLILALEGGTINNFHNLSIPNTFNISGTSPAVSVLNGDGVNAFVHPLISGDNAVINFTGSGSLEINNLTMFMGGINFNWNASAATGNIIMLDSALIIEDRLTINNGSAAASILPNGFDTSSEIIVASDAYLETFAPVNTSIDVPLTQVRGNIDILGGPSSQLSLLNNVTIQDGGRISGSGILTVGAGTGTVTVGSGGGIHSTEFFSTIGETLTINGNVLFDAGSYAAFAINNISSGFSSLFVNGGVTIDPATSLFVGWHDYGTNGVVASNPFTLISATSLTGTFGNVIEPVSISSTVSPLSTTLTSLTYTVESVDSVNPTIYWTGSGDGVNWESDANWSGNLAPGSIGNGTTNVYVVVDGILPVNLNSFADSLLGIQVTGDEFRINTGGILNVNGDFLSATDLLINGTGTITGSGAWHNLGFAAMFGSNHNISISNIDNYAALYWAQLTPVAANLTLGSVFNNWGSTLFITPSSTSNNVSLTGGFTNRGYFQASTTNPLNLTGTFSNDIGAEINITEGNVNLNTTTSNLNGLINVNVGSVLGLNGGTHTFVDGMTFLGDLGVSGGVVNIEGALTLNNLTLSGGTLNVDTLGLGTDLTI